jgi:hypothetical protein
MFTENPPFTSASYGKLKEKKDVSLMKRLALIIPIMIIVAFLAMWLIEKKYAEVPFDSRILIAVGGSILSGIIAYFLLKNDVHKVDEKPVVSNKKKR